MSSLHPRIRMPLWVAVVLPLGAYVIRSAIRGFDFRPDVPIDLVVLVMYLSVLGAAYLSRRASARQADEGPAREEQHERQET